MGKDDIVPTSDVLKHINKQTFGADASAAIAEAIPTFGYSEQGSSGFLLLGAFVMPAAGVDFGFSTATNAQTYTCQIQAGNRMAAPALVNVDHYAHIAEYRRTGRVTTSAGHDHYEMPLPLHIFRPTPVLVTQEFTICHDAANDAVWNSKVVYVILHFMTVSIPDKVYMRLMMDQQRQS